METMPKTQCPYPGIRPFRRDETHLFFGRDRQTDELISRLGETHFLAVVGTSGCGKSSLVRTGLVPGLETGLLARAGVRWRVVEMRPGGAPFRNLAGALAKVVGGPDSEDYLRSGPLGLHELLAQQPLPGGGNLLLVVDQFEELFRYATDDDTWTESAAFCALLLSSARPYPLPDGRTSDDIYVVITMRSDFIGDCAQFPGLPEAINAGLYLTPRLTRTQLREAIEEPPAVTGGRIEAALVNRLLSETGHDPDQLPLLQHLLQWLCVKVGIETPEGAHLTLDAYDATGGFGKALSGRLDDIFENELDGEQRRIAEILFRSLSKRDVEQRDIRRPVRLGEVAGIAGVDPDRVAEVVDVFGREGRNFLVTSPEGAMGPNTVIDVSHESLLRQWERLKEWLADEARSAEMYERLEKAAVRWKNEEGSLWSDLDLSNALAWYERVGPSPEWAKRYGGHFDLALRFLEASEERRRREEEERKWEFRERTESLFESQLTHASLLARIEDYDAAREILSQTRDLDPDMPAERRHARNLMAWYVDLMGGTENKVYEGAGAVLQNVAVSPDGKTLAAVGERGTVVLFDEESGDVVGRLEGHRTEDSAQETSVRAAVFHPDDEWLATAGDDRRIILWSVPEGKKLREWEAPGQVGTLALSPDGITLASGGTDNDVTLWIAETGEKLNTLEGHQGMVSGLAFSPDGSLLASASYDRTARVSDVEAGETRHVLRGHTARVQGLAFHPEKNILASSSDDKYIVLWNFESGAPTAVLRGHQNYVFGLKSIDNGRRLVSGGMDRTLRIWDTDTGVTLRVLQGHAAGVTGIAVTDDAIYSAANDGTIRRWGSGIDDFRVVDLPGELISSAISSDGKLVAIGFADGKVKVFSMPTFDTKWQNDDEHTTYVKNISFSPDGKQLATASFDNTIKLWQTEDGKLLQTFEGHSDAVHAVAFSPDDNRIASASFDGRIGLFEVGEEKGRFHEAHEGRVASVVFGKEGKTLLSAGDDGAIRLWNIQTWPPEQIKEFPKSNEMIIWATLSPDGSRIAAVGRDLLVHIYNTETGEEEHAFVGHEQTVYRVEFSLDGGQVATVSWDATVRFWDLKTKSELFTINLPSQKGPPAPLWDFSFQCTPTGDCHIAVPLTSGKLVLYRMEGIYKD